MTRNLKSWQAYGIGISLIAVALVMAVFLWMISPLIIFAMLIFFAVIFVYAIWQNRHILMVDEKEEPEKSSKPKDRHDQ